LIAHAASSRWVRIPGAADVDARRVRDLSGDITLKPGELRIEFFGAEDLRQSSLCPGDGERLECLCADLRRGRPWRIAKNSEFAKGRWEKRWADDRV
jgi:hypothetical protein